MRNPLPILLCASLMGCVTETLPTPASNLAGDTSVPIDETLASQFSPVRCRNGTKVIPGPNESGHLIASVVTPVSYPWRVDTIHAGLANEPTESGVTCDATKSHRLMVWRLGPTGFPPVDSPPDATFEVGEVDLGESAVRDIELAMDPPLELQSGERLAIALQFAGSWPDTSCVAACRDNWMYGGDLLSGASEPPYVWRQLGDDGVSSHVWLYARGTPLL